MKHTLTRIFLSLLIVLTFIQAVSLPLSANSGPTYWAAAPSSGLAVNSDSKISVTHEKLDFDFTKTNESSDEIALVSASYEMLNTDSAPSDVMMAFPLIGSVREGTAAVKSISVDGVPVEYDVYYGSKVNPVSADIEGVMIPEYDISSLELSEILDNTITVPSENEPVNGTEYFFDIDVDKLPAEYDRVYLTVRVSYDKNHEKSIYYSGWNGYSLNDDGTFTLNAWIYRTDNNKSLNIFVPDGADAGFDINTYESYDMLNTIGDDYDEKYYTFNEKSAVSFREYSGCETDGEYYVLLDYIDNYSGGANNLYDLKSEAFGSERIIVLLYHVSFDANASKNVTVTYEQRGTMDRPSGYSSTGVTYTYVYISNPAKNWVDFGTLDISIRGVDTISYSNIELEHSVDSGIDIYSAGLNALPDSNIIFRTGTPATQEQLDELRRDNFWRSLKFFLPIILTFVAIVGAIAAIIITVSIIKKKKNK